MNARNTSSTSAKTGPERKKTGIKEISTEDQARIGAMVQTTVEGTPRQMQQTLAALEASGELGPDEDIVQDEVAGDDQASEMDTEVDLGDEDEPLAREWEDDGAPLSDSDADGERNATPFAPLRFEIVVFDGRCTVPIDSRWIRNPCTANGAGQKTLYALSSRVWTLQRIAAWLADRRSEFLRLRDIWQLGCEALEDVKQGRIPIQQKSFLDCAGLNPRVSRDNLSRFIRATDIAWSDGSAPLDIIFSTAAHRAWVANAVKQFVEERQEKVTPEFLAAYQMVKVKRSEEPSLLRMRTGKMDLPSFIQKANMLAGTQWAEVIAQYGERMKE